MRLRHLGLALMLAGVAALAVAVPALAFDCNNAKKPTGNGSVAVLDGNTGDVISINKNNPGDDVHIHGGFVTLDYGALGQFDTHTHAHEGVLPPVQEGGPQHDCDGKGHDSVEVCLGL